MSRYVNLPTLLVDFCAPTKMSFDTPGGGLSGGQNGLGESITIDISGGPQLVGAYEQCNAYEPEQHEYLNMVAARMNGGHRFMNVPINTDFMGMFGAQGPFVTGIPHSDGSLFSDSAGYSQATVWGRFGAPAGLNAGQVVIDIVGAVRNLRWSEWFSVYHPDKGWRAYRTWQHSDPEPRTVATGGHSYPAQRYTVAISPPLRSAVVTHQPFELARPRCAMKFAEGFTLPYAPEGNFEWRPTLKFTEAW